MASSATVNLPSQATPIYPVLQAQDGSFVGAVGAGPSPGTVTQYNMVGFNSSGNVSWNVPNDWPQIATADGGVIGTSGITYDNQGRATGQLALMATQSWLGNAYQDDPGQAQQVASMPPAYASSYAAVDGGSPSPNGSYVPSLGAIYRSQIASDAKGYVGNSTTWKEGDPNPPVTCNIFVSAVLSQASNEASLNIPAPTRPTRYRFGIIPRVDAFLAADWANPNTDGMCWKPLPAGPGGALPGDVIATGWPPNGPDGTGHVGIVVEPDSGTPNYKDSSAADVAPYWWTPAQQQGFIPGTITLTDYGFRLPGFDFTNPSDVQGLERDSHVRRFQCY